MSFFKVNSKCNGCLACVQNCPASALKYEDSDKNRKIMHNISLCARCGNCWRVCPQSAIEFKALLDGQWEDVADMNLVLCKVCGEPLYTMDFKETVSGRLNREIDSLCAKHRQTLTLSVWKNFIPRGEERKAADL